MMKKDEISVLVVLSRKHVWYLLCNHLTLTIIYGKTHEMEASQLSAKFGWWPFGGHLLSGSVEAWRSAGFGWSPSGSHPWSGGMNERQG
jgi:hypothetical protein